MASGSCPSGHRHRFVSPDVRRLSERRWRLHCRHENIGENAVAAAATALLIDYVLTVSVSMVAGVAAITSAVPELADQKVAISVGFILW